MRSRAGFRSGETVAYRRRVPANPLLELPDMGNDLLRVEDELLAAVQTTDALLTEMASHLIRAGGKRQRPAFAVAAGACAAGEPGPVPRDVVLGGVSVELVHLGSLYHDDVIDEAVTRRTVESVNARWGNLRAILAGDFLLAKASEIAASLGTEVAGLLAATIGRLCEGEVRELEAAYDVSRTEDAYLLSIDGKTASLFSAAARIGGIVAGLPREHIDALTTFGTAYGTAFQIVDDILDVVATDEQLGKPAGHDLVEGVYTLPVLRALAGPEGDELRTLLGKPIEGADVERARQLVQQGTRGRRGHRRGAGLVRPRGRVGRRLRRPPRCGGAGRRRRPPHRRPGRAPQLTRQERPDAVVGVVPGRWMPPIAWMPFRCRRTRRLVTVTTWVSVSEGWPAQTNCGQKKSSAEWNDSPHTTKLWGPGTARQRVRMPDRAASRASRWPSRARERSPRPASKKADMRRVRGRCARRLTGSNFACAASESWNSTLQRLAPG